MQTSIPAQTLETFLSTKIRHSHNFSSPMDLASEINSTLKALEERFPFLQENPFVTGVYAVTIDKQFIEEEIRLDRDRLFSACHQTLSLTPIDEIAPTSISIFGRLCSPEMSYEDRLKSVKVITHLLLRAKDLDAESRQNIVIHCESAINELRRNDCINDDIEKEVTRNIYEQDALKIVEHLDFDSRNIQSLKRNIKRFSAQSELGFRG